MKSSILQLLFILSLSLFFLACSSEEIRVADAVTLRSKVEVINDSVEWTEDELVEREEVQTLAENQIETPLTFFETITIYPELKGFGSLDNSDLPKELLQELDSFFADFPESTATDFLLKDRTFLPFFLQRSLYGFNISSWLYGIPIFNEENMFEFPVRLYSDDSYVDILVFITKIESDFYIDQVQIGEIIRG